MTTARAPRSGRTRYTRAALQEQVNELQAQLQQRNVSPQLPPADTGLDPFRELADSVVRVMLWRKRSDAQLEYLQTYPAAEFSLEAIREAWGGGRFLARSFDAGNEEQGEREFSIAAPVRLPTADQLSIDLGKLIEQRNGNGHPPPAPAAPVPNVMASVTEFARAAAAVLSVLAPIMRPAGDDTTKLILLELFKQKSPDTLDQLVKLRELLGDAAVPASDGGYADVVRELGKPLVQMLARTQPPAPASSPAPDSRELRQLPQPESSPAPVRVRLGTRTPFIILEPHVPALVELAKSGADPKLWAAAIELEAPDAVNLLAGVVARVGTAGAVKALSDQFPDLEPFAAWVTQLVNELIADDGGDGDDDGDGES